MKYSLDTVAEKIAALGVPGLVLIITISSVGLAGGAAIVTALATLGGPLGMMGGIDKRALAAGPAAIDAELARIRPAMEKGRYIPDLDHLVPDDVSWDNYCYYAEALKRLVGKE